MLAIKKCALLSPAQSRSLCTLTRLSCRGLGTLAAYCHCPIVPPAHGVPVETRVVRIDAFLSCFSGARSNSKAFSPAFAINSWRDRSFRMLQVLNSTTFSQCLVRRLYAHSNVLPIFLFNMTTDLSNSGKKSPRWSTILISHSS